MNMATISGELRNKLYTGDIATLKTLNLGHCETERIATITDREDFGTTSPP